MRADVYDDATGKPIECTGQPTIGYGCRCRQWSEGLARAVLEFQLDEFEAPLLVLPWYIGCNDARRSALLEIAFNEGDAGLEHGWPHLIGDVRTDNWAGAKAQCHTQDPRLQGRYSRIGDILLTGNDTP